MGKAEVVDKKVSTRKRAKGIKLLFSESEYSDVIRRKPEGVTLAKWIRELSLSQEMQPKRKPRSTPKVDPVLIREISRLGNNINQIARGVNKANQSGEALSMATIVALLSSIDDQLTEVRKESTRVTKRVTT